MAEPAKLKPLVFVGSSRRDLQAFSEDAKDVIGLALMRVQFGDHPASVKPLHGFGGAGVLEVIADDDGSTYRTVYTVKFAGRIYVLHAFQKKSKSGRATPKNHVELVKRRLKQAEQIHCQWLAGIQAQKGTPSP
jgi:phage-related protein